MEYDYVELTVNELLEFFKDENYRGNIRDKIFHLILKEKVMPLGNGNFLVQL